MKEVECTYRIIAFVNGKRVDVGCNSGTGCLRELVWSGIGVRKAAAEELKKRGKALDNEKIEAYVEGRCLNEPSI